LLDDEPKIKVFASDDNLKSLGELLSNDSSRKIIFNLMNQAMYTNEIATTLDMRVSLVIHHLKKMEELGMVTITEKKIKRKGQEHRFFKINSDIFVTINKTKEDIEKQGILKRIFRDGIKFAVIGFIGILSWVHMTTTHIEYVENSTDYTYTTPLLIIVIGLIVVRIWEKYEKKNKGESYDTG